MAYDQSGFEIEAPVVDEVGAIILKARELLSDPKRWTKHGYFRQSETCPKGAYCILGALGARTDADAELMNDGPVVARLAAQIPPMRGLKPWEHITVFNDTKAEHADVLALLDRAIAGGGK